MRTALALTALVLCAAPVQAEPISKTSLPASAYAALSAAGYAIVADPRSDATVFTFYCTRPIACHEPVLDSARMPGPYQFLSEPHAAGNDRAARRRRA